jgi:hypothetical protein
MPVGSLSSTMISNAYLGSTDTTTTGAAAAKAQTAAAKPDVTVADHVAAADEQAPIRSAGTTQGTLVDTYL